MQRSCLCRSGDSVHDIGIYEGTMAVEEWVKDPTRSD